MSKICDAPHKQRHEGCVAGCCDYEGRPNWCEDVSLESQSVYGCAFKPTDLKAMVRHHEKRVSSTGYNEGMPLRREQEHVRMQPPQDHGLSQIEQTPPWFDSPHSCCRYGCLGT